MLSVNTWMVINSITFKIFSIQDIDEMRMEVIAMLNKIIDFDSSSFYLASSLDNPALSAPVGSNYSAADMKEYIDRFQYDDYSLGLMSTGENITYKESDILEDALRVETGYYKEVYNVQGWHFSLHLNLSYQEHFVGVFSLFRSKEKPDFEYRDIFILDMIKKHLAFRIYEYISQMQLGRPTPAEFAGTHDLSARELSVLKLLAVGDSSADIAEELDISENTVKKHISNIYRKTDVNSQIQLMKILRT